MSAIGPGCVKTFWKEAATSDMLEIEAARIAQQKKGGPVKRRLPSK
jgi:predicted outer membrane protein